MAESRQYTGSSNRKHERFKLKIFYLKSPAPVKGFMPKLPQTVKIIEFQENSLKKGKFS